ncbi:phosphoribosylaminoimidazolesuccinocarboxamide synthase [Membranicola marinus]|uniref:Phosphoribosylaminoimidazole-succinocarboxamide synthase n=1 Tax=Membranihabitans marinus TaxID=1227546 RepID=A0A953L9M2_9BACT|nr:phosphoribosylaminoimidazolesuccinocarboxamide synthase [Membranihabitans marinus]MBY5957763.1 phosphoribosylaminoimidazolesuccinocarboxamide synthase [Membranihabitans marinus]
MNAIPTTHFEFPNQTNVYHGKVRDVYDLGDRLLMIATDRISAFDHILPKPIPFKGQVLNQIAAYFLDEVADIVPHWLLATPDPNVSYGIKCDPIKIEMVVRGYLAGHAWREYKAGKRILCGVAMPDGMKESQAFPRPIVTPATKADEGHDEDISVQEILEQGIVSKNEWEQLESYALALFDRGSAMARDKGLILVDTKYEFGFHAGKIYLIDEIHTPDSSRYYYATGYEDRLNQGEKQQQLSKEFVREWLMEHGFQGLDGQVIPEMPDEFVQEISQRYITLYEKMTGKSFEPAAGNDPLERIEKNVLAFLNTNNS